MCPQCEHPVLFSKIQCTNCSAGLAYNSLADQMVAVAADASLTVVGHSLCGNRERIGCNWLCDTQNHKRLCLSCLHTIKIPNTSTEKGLLRWSRLERSKRRLFYSLLKFGLPLAHFRDASPGSLRFELLGDQIAPDGKTIRVMTGHDHGRITINIAEADDEVREANRIAMGEPYRTLLGHFRHEVGHYYWDQLVDREGVVDRFRECFGDERANYSDALKTYYKNGPPEDWNLSFVSTYAAAHPWEDFAETWAHHFHMVAGLETAYWYGINP